ncbi:MAG: hypothetical protein ACR2K4_06660, partial [Candidatus Limnocylindria bacterium]
MRLVSRWAWPVAALLTLAACSSGPPPDATPSPTTFPVASPESGVELTTAYLDDWAAGDYAAMYAAVDGATRQRYPMEAFSQLHAAFADMAQVEVMSATPGQPHVVALPPEPRPEEFPDPTLAPAASPDASAAPSAATPPPLPTFDPADPLPGPVPGLEVPFGLTVDSGRFGSISLERALTLVQGRDGWLLRWSPAVVFPELGDDGMLRLDRSLGARGRIVGTDATVWAETRDDGTRVYPQEALAGQAIGYLSEVTAEDLGRLAEAGYRADDVVGRSGLEAGAEDLLRGTPGWSLVAERLDAPDAVLLETEMVPGADVEITLRPTIQSAAQSALSPYDAAATAVVDPATGDVWALASQPAFNPNAMT